MGGHHASTFLVAALLVLGRVDAVNKMRMPVPTPAGLMADVGMSPLPTDPPNVPAGTPRELVPRQNSASVPLPPPGFWCGLVEGNPNNALTCLNAAAQCVSSGSAVGCCFSSDITDCTALPTKCLEYDQKCDKKCQSDSQIIHCTFDTSLPYCDTFAFGTTATLLGCNELADQSSQVQMFSDYFSSELGPSYTTMISASTSDDWSVPTSSEDPSTSTSSSSTSSSTDGITTSPPNPSPGGSDTGGGDSGGGSDLSDGAIAGIVVGVVVPVAALAGFLAWLFVVKRRRAAPQPQQPPVTQVPPPQPPHDPSQGTYGQVPPAAGGTYYVPENKPVNEPPGYATYDPQSQPQQSPEPSAATPREMPGSPMPPAASPHPADGVSTMGSNPPQSAHSTQMSSQAGPVPENVYEMGTGR